MDMTCVFGLPRSHSDINVIERYFVFIDLVEGHPPSVNYSIHNHDYTMGYDLADNIYPSWASLLKTIHAPQKNMRKHFVVAQELAIKDVEQAFRVIQARFEIMCGPACFCHIKILKKIMMACIMLHNMNVEDEVINILEHMTSFMKKSMRVHSNHCHMSIHLNLRTSYTVIITLEMYKPILNSSWTLSSIIYGKYIANNGNLQF